MLPSAPEAELAGNLAGAVRMASGETLVVVGGRLSSRPRRPIGSASRPPWLVPPDLL